MHDHIYPCDSAGYQNELLYTNLQKEYTNGLDDVLASYNAGLTAEILFFS